MAITNYQELIESIGGWLNRSDLTQQAPDFIDLCHNRLCQIIRVPTTERIRNYTKNGETYFDIPSDFLELKLLLVNGKPLYRTTDLIITSEELQSEVPEAYCRIGDRFYFNAPVSGQLQLVYWFAPTALSQSVTTNEWLRLAPALYLYGSLMEAAPYLMDDERLSVWERKFAMVVDELEDHYRRSELAGGGLQIRGSYQ